MRKNVKKKCLVSNFYDAFYLATMLSIFSILNEM